jgi:hypothetical protein
MDDKVDVFDFVTTNASQFDQKPKEKPLEAKKKVSRSNSVKAKDVNPNKKDVLTLDILSVRCKTSKCVSRKSRLQDKRLRNK